MINDKNSYKKKWYQQSEMRAWRQFLLLIGLFCAGFLAAIYFTMIAAIVTPNVHLTDLANSSSLPYALTVSMAIIQDICMFVLPAFLFAKIITHKKNYFQFHRQSPLVMWLLALVIAFAALPVSDFFAQINEWIPISKKWTAIFKSFENNYGSALAAILNFKTFGNFLFSLVLIALLPAVTEELFFRGALQQVMLKWTKKIFPAIIITAIIFSAIHGSYYGFLPRAFLGVVLGYVYYYGKNIWLNMLIHFINNAVVIIALYITYGSKPLTQKMLDNDSFLTPWYAQFAGILVLILLMILFIKKSKKIQLKRISENSESSFLKF